MICNKSQLAEILGVDITTLTNWQKDGMPFAPRRGRENTYESAAVVKWMIDRETLAFRKARTEAGQIDGDHEKARKDKAMADRYELDLQVRRGELLEAKGVIRVWAKQVRAMRSRLLSIPTKLAPLVVSFTDPHEARAVIAEEIHDALVELGGGEMDAGVAIDPEPDPVPAPKRKPARKAAKKRSKRKA